MEESYNESLNLCKNCLNFNREHDIKKCVKCRAETINSFFFEELMDDWVED